MLHDDRNAAEERAEIGLLAAHQKFGTHVELDRERSKPISAYSHAYLRLAIAFLPESWRHTCCCCGNRANCAPCRLPDGGCRLRECD